MTSRKIPVDKVRASRGGHEYHEAWTARKSMQLLWPDSNLAAIAVEGLSPQDQRGVSASTVEIADLALYHGNGRSFQGASRMSIVQFKYSIADENAYFRASHAKKTITKFAQAYRDHMKKYGPQAVQDRLDFELITNRPVYTPLIQAIDALAKGLPRTGEIGRQAKQFQTASGLEGKQLTAFAGKCKIIGLSGDLTAIKNELAGLLVDWSAANDDPLAAARLGELRQMIRDKAGHVGTSQNLITRTDILATLRVAAPEDLLPCPTAIPEIGKVVRLEQLGDAIDQIRNVSAPLLIHATGGVGKTVFMATLGKDLQEDSEVVLFDCFGGGAYRSLEDARHLPRNGLVHIANTLAFRGLCDPILPGSPDVSVLLRTFRRRLSQCVATLSRVRPVRTLIILIDAIDNAELIARQRSEDSFPICLLESLHTEPIPGVKVVVSCRTERKPSTYSGYVEFELRPFSIDETAAYLRARLKNVSEAEINVAQARSAGNPRVLEYLVKSGRGLLDDSEVDKKLDLDELIQGRITQALSSTIERGYKQEDINAFLAGLAVLPPPVPLDEYAGAHGIEVSAIESFASDLSPLLERTNQGLMFRDEPTETLIRRQYAFSEASLRRLAANLFARQDVSVYAARALPGLLHTLDDGEQLFQLAFDDRIPASITSTVGKRNIRYARVKAPALHAAMKQDYNRLVRLLIELSTIAATDQRGTDYILGYPDLVVAAKDVDATRRLFEARTGWPGTRHARLAIANSLSGALEEAYRNAIATNDWIYHYRQQDHRKQFNQPQPARSDIAALPFFFVCEGRPHNATNFLRGWRDWYAYEVCELVLAYSQLAISLHSLTTRKLAKFIFSLTDVGPLTAALSFQELRKGASKALIAKVAQVCSSTTKLSLAEAYRRECTYQLQDGLRKTSAIALSLGLTDEALTISQHAPHRRPGTWSLRGYYYHHDVFPFVFQIALDAAAKNRTLREKDVLPADLIPICSRIGEHLEGEDFRKKLKEELPKYVSQELDERGAKKEPRTLSYDEKQEAERFIDQRLQPLLALTKALASFLAASSRQVDDAFIELLKVWEAARKSRDPYGPQEFDKLFRPLGLEMALFALWTRSELKLSSVKRFLMAAHAQEVSAPTLIQIVSILAQRKTLQALAGEQAQDARTLIQTENDVTQRASFLADLGRAMLPASIDDAVVYFRDGLDQMDAIGSGDYRFTNELLIFASTIKGDGLDEQDFHTLTNICELNITEEPEKFFWGAFARGLSKTAGPRGLAKLTRWDDRSKVRMSNTLLPYLTALVNDGKIGLDIAVALNRLANPVEYWYDGTAEFAKAIQARGGTTTPEIVSELIKQFEDDNPGIPMNTTVEALASLAEQTFGRSSERTTYLSAAHGRFKEARESINAQSNYRGKSDPQVQTNTDNQDNSNRAAIRAIVQNTDPSDQASLIQGVKEVNALTHVGNLGALFLTSVREKVAFNARAKYLSNICTLEGISLHWKLVALKECNNRWGKSSVALAEVLKSAAIPLTQVHADDLVDPGGFGFSGSQLKEISDLTGVPVAVLVLELIKVFARPERSVSGDIWLAFASFVCPEADDGQGQLALKRLLGSDVAKLADIVVDGPWVKGLYPGNDLPAIAAGMIWRMLGSPGAEDRWRAAHSMRCFARLGRWDVIDSVVGKVNEKTAGPFQAGELKFYYLHARLWLLIALARMALDHPTEVARYRAELLSIATEAQNPHVLMRDFAGRALIACISSGNLSIQSSIVDQLRAIDLSPYPRLKEKIRKGGGFYQGRPNSAPKANFEFHLDYDFHKYDVENLSEVFGRPCWQVEDLISNTVHQLDPNANSMYQPDGRVSRDRYGVHGMSTRLHTYGQHLGWHALFLAAGQLLKNYPVTDDWHYHDDPWGEWLGRYVLSRDDGLWLSDGTDRSPLDVAQVLLEETKHGLALTGDPVRLLQLAGLKYRIGKEVVAYGSWHSADNIEVHISSALVPHTKAQRLARKLVREEPMTTWIPNYYGTEEDAEHSRGDKKEYNPWIFCPTGETKLDEHDPFGTPWANLRPRLSRDYISALSITTDDPFGRYWRNRRGGLVLRAQAWERKDLDGDRGDHSGLRLYCSTSSLKQILSKYNNDLLLLISLRRYEKEGHRADSKFTHTVAVVRISKTLDLEYFKGRINHVYTPRQ